MDGFLGIDVGTTGVRAIIMDAEGKVAAEGKADHALHIPRPNWAEQDPADWWSATIKAVRACIRRASALDGGRPPRIMGIGLTGQMHGTVFLDDDGEVLRPAMLWCDQRTDEQCAEIEERVGGRQTLVELTSNKAINGFSAPKILWVKENEPEVYARTSKVLLPKDYVRYMMTGSMATDVSDASGTLLFDVANRKWSWQMHAALGIPGSWMPDCAESPEIVARITREASGALGIAEGTPVVAGAGDQAAGAVGNGVVTAGAASCALGTSGVVFWHCDQPVFDRQARLHSFCHAVPGKWHLMGVTLAAGGSLRWFRDALCHEEVLRARASGRDPYDLMMAEAQKVGVGSEGLLFLPYLAGERTPHTDANARGAFVGLSLAHSKAHMTRAVVEGVTMSLRDCVELAREVGTGADEIRVTGGGAKSKLWREILAATMNSTVNTTSVDEGPAYGAAVLAAVGVGAFGSVEQACTSLIRVSESVEADDDQVRAYDAIYSLYRPLYGALKPFFERSACVFGRS
jgi:xylulokinase